MYSVGHQQLCVCQATVWSQRTRLFGHYQSNECEWPADSPNGASSHKLTCLPSAEHALYLYTCTYVQSFTGVCMDTVALRLHIWCIVFVALYAN